MKNLNGYIALYKGKQTEIYAESSYQAQQKAMAYFKTKKGFEISVYLCEQNGKEVTQSTNF